jgi:hypothetical protein
MNIHNPKKSKRPDADRRWTVLFIGDHGNVVTLKRFKAIVIGAGSLFFLAIVFVAVLLFLNIGTLKQNKNLQRRFANSEKQIEKLRHEKEIWMARLVRAEANAKENVAGDRQIQEKMKAAESAAPPPQVASKPKPVKSYQKKPSVPRAAQPKPAPGETDEAGSVISVAVENFKVSRESENKNLNARFKIKNTSAEPQRVAGHAVVVLKGNDLQKDKWLVMPAVALAGGKPTGRRGKSFSIQRFRTMSFTSKAPNHSDQFQTAAVYVFTKSGQLLLEKDFSVKLPPAPLTSSDAPSAQTSSSKTPSGETQTSEVSSGETQTSEVTSGETPPSDDPLNSLNSAPPVF